MDLLVVAGSSGYLGSNLVAHLKACVDPFTSLLAVNRSRLDLYTYNKASNAVTMHHPTWKDLCFSNYVNSRLIYSVSNSTPNTSNEVDLKEVQIELSVAKNLFINLSSISSLTHTILISSAGSYSYDDSFVSESSISYPFSSYSIYCALKERLFTELIQNSSQKLCIARLTNLYGPPLNISRTQGFLNTLICNYLSSTTTFITANPKSLRNYLYIHDACSILTKILLLDFASFPTGLLLVSSDQYLSINDIIKYFKTELSGLSPSPIQLYISHQPSSISINQQSSQISFDQSKLLSSIASFNFTSFSVGLKSLLHSIPHFND